MRNIGSHWFSVVLKQDLAYPGLPWIARDVFGPDCLAGFSFPRRMPCCVVFVNTLGFWFGQVRCKGV